MSEQFATAWRDGETQILVYLWYNDEDGWFAQHMAVVNGTHRAFSLRFREDKKAKGYFSKVVSGDLRAQITAGILGKRS